MDDTSRSITFQVKGKPYRFAPLTEDQITALMMLSGTRGSARLFKVMALSMGDEQYDAITDRLVDPDDSLSTKDIGKLMERLVKVSAKQADNVVDDGDDDD